jgi:hypothetical protein
VANSLYLAKLTPTERAELGRRAHRPNLADILRVQESPAYDVPITVRGDTVSYCFPELGLTSPIEAPVCTDPLSLQVGRCGLTPLDPPTSTTWAGPSTQISSEDLVGEDVDFRAYNPALIR